MAERFDGHVTRAWKNPTGDSSTIVQVSTDRSPPLWLHTNLGWMPIATIRDDDGEELTTSDMDRVTLMTHAVDVAEGYGLEEVDDDEAVYWADWGPGWKAEEDEEDEGDEVGEVQLFKALDRALGVVQGMHGLTDADAVYMNAIYRTWREQNPDKLRRMIARGDLIEPKH